MHPGHGRLVNFTLQPSARMLPRHPADPRLVRAFPHGNIARVLPNVTALPLASCSKVVPICAVRASGRFVISI